MLEYWRRWRDDPFRRAMDEQNAGIDVIGARAAAALMLTHCICFTWLKEGRPVAALGGAPYMLMCLALASLAQRRRAFYVRHRELLVTTLHLAQTVTNYQNLLHAGDDVFRAHNGSPLRLALMHLAGGPIFITISALHARLSLAWSVVALPAVTLAPQAHLPSLCRRLMSTPGAEGAVVGLFRAMDTFHIARSPMASLLPLPPMPEPRQCSLLYNMWCLWCCSVLIPLAVTYVLERRARRRYRASEAARSARGSPPPEEAPPSLPVSGWWAVDAYLASCFVWAVAEVTFA